MITKENYVGKIPFEQARRVLEEAAQNNHQYWANGFPVSKEFLAFINEVKYRWTDMVLCLDEHSTRDVFVDDDSYRVFCSFKVTAPDSLDMRVGGLRKTSDKYEVESKEIKNEKYASHGRQYNIRKSKDMAKAIKVARQYIKPPTFQFVRSNSLRAAETALHHVKDPAREKFRNTLSIQMDDISEEVNNMILSGYAPVTKSFREALDVLVAEGAELKRLKDYKPKKCFVWSRQNSLVYQYDGDLAEREINNLGELPEELKSKLSVLNIADEHSPIADVGVRVSNNTFWVFV